MKKHIKYLSSVVLTSALSSVMSSSSMAIYDKTLTLLDGSLHSICVDKKHFTYPDRFPVTAIRWEDSDASYNPAYFVYDGERADISPI